MNQPTKETSISFGAESRQHAIVAPWIYFVLSVVLVEFVNFARQETSGRLTIVTILYALGAFSLLLLVLRLTFGQMHERRGSIQPRSSETKKLLADEDGKSKRGII